MYKKNGMAVLRLLLLNVFLVGVNVSRANKMYIYESYGFDFGGAPTNCTIHLHNWGYWDTAVPDGTSSPYYRHWEIKSGDVNDAKVIDIGGGYGNVLSFKNNVYVNLQLGWQGSWSYSGEIQTIIIEYDFYQKRNGGNISGYMFTLRNSQQVIQTKIHPENGLFKAALRKDSSEAPIEMHLLASYSEGVWHHVKIEQRTQVQEDYGTVKIWLDGQEITGGHTYYTQWPCWNGYIDAIQINGNVSGAAQYYIDNVKVLIRNDVSSPVPDNLQEIGYWLVIDPASVSDFDEPHSGDANRDGAVNGNDLNILLSNWGTTGVNWASGDFNDDGSVGGEDLNMLLSEWGWTASDEQDKGATIYFSKNLSRVIDASTIGMQGLINIDHVFFREVYDPYDVVLRGDYQRCWKAFKDLIKPLYESGLIAGFMLKDEAVWNGAEVSDVETIVDTIRNDFPSAIIYYNEALAIWTSDNNNWHSPENSSGEPIDFSIPEGVTWFSADWYIGPEHVKEGYRKCIYPLLARNQRAVLVPEAYGPRYDDNGATMCARADFYYDWAKNDPMIAGIMPWHYDNDEHMHSHGSDEWIGLSNISSLLAKWEGIADEINYDYERQFPSWVKPVQDFSLFASSGTEQLPSTYAFSPWNGNDDPVPDSNVFFERAWENTYIKMLSEGKFRYCWGTNDPNTDRIYDQWDNPGDSLQNIQFDIYVSDSSSVSTLYVFPYRGWAYPLSVFITHWGIGYHDDVGDHYMGDFSVFNTDSWNTVIVRIDKLNHRITISVNGNEVGSEIYSPVDGETGDKVFTSVAFRNYGSGSVYLDNIGIWHGDKW